MRDGNGVQVFRRVFARQALSEGEAFLTNFKAYISSISPLSIAEFQITHFQETTAAEFTVQANIRYEFIGAQGNHGREQRIGEWITEWTRHGVNGWRVSKWEVVEETVARCGEAIFTDISSASLGHIGSYEGQMLRGVDYWRTVLDGACGIDVYGNNGLAVGDFDNDGWDDLYICQSAGLPNRLYRNRSDGTFEDVTEKSGVGVLDNTSCALFADFENKGVQDLLVVCGSGPLLFLNDGKGNYSLKHDAFKFGKSPEGTFTHAAIADYDHDGHLDIYFCLYNYYAGLDQYRYPVPYFDARNGPPNFLLHNEGHATFRDRTAEAGLNVDNNRYSFACAWGDHNGNGWPDLYVANDFGRSNLYHNNGDGTFKAISTEAGVEDPGAGMSACWFDFDNDGKQDVYVANMWSAAGMRVSEQNRFHAKEPEEIRGLCRRHARGNSLYRNQGNGKFQNVASQTGIEMGRWAWCSDAWDFDHDGYSDLYVANGYISGADSRDIASFFWRQVVGNSPQNSAPSPRYEHGWNAINELIRSDASWSGRERNVFYANNHDGTFSDISGIAGLDFRDDSRAFAVLDLDRDGRLEVALKNRNVPQLRILRNSMRELGQSIAFRLRGTKSNRDAIGAAVTIETASPRQTKYVQAGSGFLSQHTKELFFGLGDRQQILQASIRWPSGLVQTFEQLPVGHRIEVEEGNDRFMARAFATSAWMAVRTNESRNPESLPESVQTWLIEPLPATDFSLPDLRGKLQSLELFRGKFVLLNFWATGSPVCSRQLRELQQNQRTLDSAGAQVLAINVDEPRDEANVQRLASELHFPVLLATNDVAGIYNILFRYLYDRRQDLPLPTSFLVDPQGYIVKIYQGPVTTRGLVEDVQSVPKTAEERVHKGLPFSGTLYLDAFQRNDFTYGVALFQRGYLEPAAASFKQVIAAKPQDADAHYNLGTLYLRSNNFAQARTYLEQAVKLRPNYPEAWNNLGMLAAQEGQADEAVRNFEQSLSLRPGYATALLNLGNLYRRQKNLPEAEKLIRRALEIEPQDAEANYSMGMFYAQQGLFEQASKYLQEAINLRPDHAEALNNLGVLLVREQRYTEAQEKFEECIRVAPKFDQGYLNLARLYVALNDKPKARQVLQSLLEKQPQNKMARQALEMLE